MFLRLVAVHIILVINQFQWSLSTDLCQTNARLVRKIHLNTEEDNFSQ